MGNSLAHGFDATLKTGAAARRLAVSGQTLRRYAARGLITPVVLPSGRYQWPEAELDRLIGAGAR